MSAKLTTISTPDAPAAVGPYAQAVAAGGMLYVSGQISLDPTTGQLVDGDVSAQAAQCLRNLRAVLEAGGAAMNTVVRVTVFLTSMDDFAAVNAVYAEHFGAHRPARACVEVSRLPKGVSVELDAIAATQ